MDEHRQDPEDRYHHGPDMFPLTSGNQFAPFQRQHDMQAPPQRAGAIVATTAGSLLLIALVVWFLLP